MEKPAKYMSTQRKNYLCRLRPSPRQLQVLNLMVAGKTNKQIAAQLGLSVRTIFMNQHNLRERLQAATNVEMVYLACLLGILETDLTKQTLQN